jgi:hypothetical protein
MQVIFYNEKGSAVAYLDDNKVIYLFSGQPVGYLHEGSIYSFSGRHLGRFANGWLRDNEGRCALFTGDARGFGPTKPTMRTAPTKHTKKTVPIPVVPEIAPLRPTDKLAWSPHSSIEFFQTGQSPKARPAFRNMHPDYRALRKPDTH